MEQDRPELKRRHIAAATIGNALEFYDFLTYAFFSIQIGHAFFPSQSAYGSLMLSLATFGAGFVTRPIGGLVIGAYADRVGRRPAMMLCFLLIGFSIVGMALIPTYATIGVAAPILAVAARMIQGFSLGGEIGSNTAFLMEAARPAQRGFVVAWQGASQYVALVVGGAVGTLLSALMPPDVLDAYGWRVAFLLGALAVPFGLWLRRNLPDTLERPAGPEAAPRASRLAVALAHWRVLALGLAMLGSVAIGSYVFVYVVTYAQDALHMSARAGFIAETGGNIAAVGCILFGGWLSDRLGRRPVNIWGNLLLLVLAWPTFAWITGTRSDLALIVGVTGLSGVACLTYGSIYAALAESLHQDIRSSGFGTLYSVAMAAFGGTTQLIATWLIHRTGSPMALAWYLIAAAGVGQVAVMLMPESAPGRLARLAAAPAQRRPGLAAASQDPRT